MSTFQHADKLQLQARLVIAGKIIEDLEKAIRYRENPGEETVKNIESFKIGLDLDASDARFDNSPELHKYRDLAEYFRINSSIVPAGQPRNEDVLWNAMMSLHSALLHPYISHKYDQAMRDFKEAVEFVRNTSGHKA